MRQKGGAEEGEYIHVGGAGSDLENPNGMLMREFLKEFQMNFDWDRR